MAHYMILGSAGMLGQALVKSLLAEGAPSHLSLFDVTESPPISWPDGQVSQDVGNLSDPKMIRQLIDRRPDVIFHLAAIVSGQAEQEFEKGYNVNLGAVQHLLEEIRAAHEADGYQPRLVFTSSIAVFGAPLPETIPDDQILEPRSSYGTQKAIAELLIADYSRKGYLDGISLRLPTICIRPGKPNAAASSFYSSILREPLNGQRAVLPVDPSLRHWFASPSTAIGFLRHAARIDLSDKTQNFNITMPGVTATVADQIEALRNIAGDEAVALIDHQPDAEIQKIVTTWPKAFSAEKALKMGFVADASFEAILQEYLTSQQNDPT